MSYYHNPRHMYEEDEDYDVHIRRGRVSPAPYYADPRIPVAPMPRQLYYSGHGSSYLVPESSAGGLRRARSHGRSSHRGSPPAVAPAPVIINNPVFHDPYDDHERYLQLSPPAHAHSRSRSRAGSHSSYGSHGSHGSHRSHSSHRSSRIKEDYELERTRKELEAYKLEKKREEDEKQYKKDMEYKRLREERHAEEEKKRLKKEADDAVEKFKIKEAERMAKEKKEKEAAEKDYKKRMEEDLRKSGLDERQISAIVSPEKALATQRPTYTRMSRRHLSIETLNRYGIDFESDQDPHYVLIKRLVPEWEQDFLWNHTREIRERREVNNRPVLIAIEGKKHSHHHHETELELVRKKEKRRPSPSPLLTYLAGGKK